MESLYQQVGISRQGFHKYLKKMKQQQQVHQPIVHRVQHHRIDHPRMGARPMYVMMQNKQDDVNLLKGIGKHKFEQILLDNDLRVQPIKIFHRTTYSGAFRFPNLVEGRKIKQLNRVWISDLTYYRLLNDWAYLTFILDLYSKKCIGYALSQNMTTEHTSLPALRMALKNRAIQDYQYQLSFHSDGGGQFYDKEFLKLLAKYHIRSSMSESVYENPHIERFHSTVKNDYLIPWGVNSFTKLKKMLPKLIYLYNKVRPHQALKYKTPLEFEQFIHHIPICQRSTVLFKKIT